MSVSWIVVAIFSNIIHVHCRMIPINYLTLQPVIEEVVTPGDESIEDNPYDKVIGLKDYRQQQVDYELEKKLSSDNNFNMKKPCSVVVLSNIQNPSMQSLLRKYRYDANGVLIPSSVKYFMKLPQGFGAPILVPLNDKAFSPSGGFVRYYKEVPPIPQSW